MYKKLRGGVIALVFLWGGLSMAAYQIPAENCFETEPHSYGAKNGVMITGYLKTLPGCQISELEIPETIGGQEVLSIGAESFRNSPFLQKIKIAGTVKEIRNEAFKFNASLKAIAMGEGIEKIGISAFRGCALEKLKIPSSVEEIGSYAFVDNATLRELELGDGIKRIKDRAFQRCDLTGLIIPGSVEEIGNHAFSYNTGLQEVKLGEGVKWIRFAAFVGSKTTALDIPESVIAIEASAFSGSLGLVTGYVTKNPSAYGNSPTSTLILVRKYKVEFETDGGTSIASQYVIPGSGVISPVIPTKTGFIFSGRTPAFPATIIATQTFKAEWKANTYTLIFDLDGGTGTTSLTGAYNELVPQVKDPIRARYRFLGWDIPLPEKFTQDMTIKALWKRRPSSSGGGSSSSITPDSSSFSGIATHSLSGSVVQTGTQVDSENKTPEIVSTGDKKVDPVIDELTQAYTRAFEQGITTQATLEKAQLRRAITRGELAKMMSVYATKLLGKVPLLTGAAVYPDVEGGKGDLPEYIQLAYQLQIMGIDEDGKPLKNFKPYQLVTRAEFATVLSRVLYGDRYNKGDERWYSQHLLALKKAGILKNITPNISELRGWVMLMLMRSQKLK